MSRKGSLRRSSSGSLAKKKGNKAKAKKDQTKTFQPGSSIETNTLSPRLSRSGSVARSQRRRNSSPPALSLSGDVKKKSKSGPPRTVPSQQASSVFTPGDSQQGLDALDLARPRGRSRDDFTLRIDHGELLNRIADVEDTSSLAFILDALQTVNAPTSFSEKRRNELLKIAKSTDKEHLAQQVGLRTAKSKLDNINFAPQNRRSTLYLRTGLDTLVLEVNKLTVDGKEVTKNQFPVNSPQVLNRLKLLLSSENFKKLSLEKADQGNLYFLKVSEPLTNIGLGIGKLLHDVGAMPSPYQLLKLLDFKNKSLDLGDNFVKEDSRINVKLKKLQESPSFARVKDLASRSKTQKPMYSAIVHLLKGLSSDLVSADDPLASNALDNLLKLVRIAAASDLEPATLAISLDLMMDELMVVLGSKTPYKFKDFQEAVEILENTRSPNLAALLRNNDIERHYYYASSGMDALSTAITIALGSSGTISSATKELDYFELNHLLENLKVGKVVEYGSDVKVVLAALHSSTPYLKQDIQGLVKKITGLLDQYTGHQPMSLILDTTIETDGPELNELWKDLGRYIEEGKLNVFTAKSYHKYATLGTGKLSSGVMTLVGKTGNGLPDKETSVHNLELNFADTPAAQLMTHILKHAAGDELVLITSAAANAKFIDDFCWPPVDNRDSKFVDGIPLLLRARGGKDVRPFVALLNIDKRDSFSFLRTSYVTLDMNDGSVRINPGQETKEAMVEFFYAIGHLVQNLKPGDITSSEGDLDIETVLAHLKPLDALDSNLSEAPYLNNIRASYLFLGVRLKGEKDNGALQEALRKFINEGMLGVTRDMKAQLSQHYLELYLTSNDEDDQKARKKAAALVSSNYVRTAGGRKVVKEVNKLDDDQKNELIDLLNAKGTSPGKLKEILERE